MHYNRGRGACSNTLLIARRALEEQLVAGLQRKVLNSELVAYTLDAFEEQLLAAANRKGDESALLQRRIGGIVAEGKRYPSLMERLAELERDLAEAKAKVTPSEPGEIRLRLRHARHFAETRLKHLRSVLAREPRIARAEITKHVQKITLTPEGRTYIASGT